MSITVVTSTVADGSMLISSDQTNVAVIQNRLHFLASQNIAMNQTTRVRVVYEGSDYCRYLEVSATQDGAGMTDSDVTTADALITRDSRHALFLPLADCIGAVIYDPIGHILMLSHLGRHSLEQNGGYRSVTYLQQQYACDAATLRVWLTPSAGKASYPMHMFDNRSLKEVAISQLVSAGILVDNITDDPTDTTTDKRYFSHSEFLKGNRLENGRHAIVAVMTD